MTKKVFWSDPYLTRLDTRVATVQGNELTLEETIFYALSGGQESDAGTIGGKPVSQARKAEKEIFYTLAEGHGLGAGEPVTVIIDWDRRYKLMRLHLAAELVLELVYRQLNSVEKTGAHISPEKARIDFNWPESIAPLIPVIEKEAQALIAADSPIVSAYSDEANQRRYWEIAGFAHVPCGGTHLKRTGEIGKLALKRDNRGKGQQRIVIQLGSG